MKFKLDENMPIEIADVLVSAGHDVHTVQQEGLVGASDVALMQRVASESRVIVTLDKGIADIRRYPPANYAGIVLLRPPSTGRESVREFFCRFVKQIADESIAGRLLILSESGIRIRS